MKKDLLRDLVQILVKIRLSPLSPAPQKEQLASFELSEVSDDLKSLTEFDQRN